MLDSKTYNRLRLNSGDEKVDDVKMRLIESLRGRLLAERLATSTAKEEADHLIRRLEELERNLTDEIKCRKKAEGRLEFCPKEAGNPKTYGSQEPAEIRRRCISWLGIEEFDGRGARDDTSSNKALNMILLKKKKQKRITILLPRNC